MRFAHLRHFRAAPHRKRRSMVAPALPALILVLVLATSASATCTWVLWVTVDTDDAGMKERHPEMYKTAPADFYDSRGICETALAERSRKSYDAGWRVAQIVNDDAKSLHTHRVERTDNGNVTGLSNRATGKPAGWNAYSYRCMPDTIDPRGPKGGGR